MEESDNVLPETQTAIAAPVKLGNPVHLPFHLPRGKSGNTKRKHCKFCYKMHNKRVYTCYGCSHCHGNPGLCIDPCFRAFHNY